MPRVVLVVALDSPSPRNQGAACLDPMIVKSSRVCPCKCSDHLLSHLSPVDVMGNIYRSILEYYF